MTTTVPPSISAGTPHIPAWKRIGLKLKYFGDTPIPTRGPEPALTEEKNKNPKKRKATEDLVENKKGKKKKGNKDKKVGMIIVGAEAHSPQKHKSKKDPEDKEYPKESAPFVEDSESTVALPPTPASGNTTPSSSPQKSLLKSASPAPKSVPLLSRRKSVAFTTDTKVEDGDSIKQLYLALDPFGKNRTRGGIEKPKPKLKTTGVASTSIPTSEYTKITAKKPKKLKDKTKTKTKTKTKDKSGLGKTNAHLDYIMTFYTTRSAWQFQKSKQNWILKNALNVRAIPESHTDALAAYIASLQGAGARDWLLAIAKKELEITKEGEDKNPIKEVNEEAKKRANLVMKALGHRGDNGSEYSSSEEDTSSDSSSEEDSSDSSSDNSNEDEDESVSQSQ